MKIPKDKNRSPNLDSNLFLFNCTKCGRSFDDFFLLKRHVLQVEFKIKFKCKFCLKYFKRVNEHYPHCSSYFSSHFNCLRNLRDKKNEYRQRHKKDTSFNINQIIKGFFEEFKSKEKYNIVEDSFIYFPDFIIGEGSFGVVVFGVKLDDLTPVAVKVQKRSYGENDLKIEKEILSLFQENLPFPRLYYYETNINGNLLIEALMGPTLKKLFKFCSYNLDLNSICNIGIDIIESLELLHEKGYVHLDLKADNIAIKLENINNNNNRTITCTLLDFGKAIKFTKLNKKKNY